MSIYRRYFSVPADSATGQQLQAIHETRRNYAAALQELCKEVGANSVHFYTESGAFAGFRFDEAKRDNATWRKPDKRNLVRPRLSSKAGKAIAARIAAIPKPVELRAMFEPVGLGHGQMLMFEGLRMHNAGLECTHEPFVLIVSVPWKDVDPAELEAYRQDKSRSDTNLSHLLWQPPADWEEVKGWQAEKLLDEARSAQQDAA